MFVKKQEFDKLNAKVDELTTRQNQLEDTVAFLSNHDRDEIVVNTINYNDDCHYLYQTGIYSNLKILYINKMGLLKSICTHLKRYMKLESVESIDDNICILHLKDTTTDMQYNCGDKFIQLDKLENEIIDITDIKARYENQEKVSANLKESAQALGEAFKGIFGSCTKNECKCKKSSADKTKKQETAPETKSRKNTKKEEK